MVRARVSHSNQRSVLMNRNRVNKFRYKEKILDENNKWGNTLFQDSLNTETNDDTSMFDSINEPNITSLLRSWVNCHGITTRAVNDLLGILRRSGCYQFFQTSEPIFILREFESAKVFTIDRLNRKNL